MEANTNIEKPKLAVAPPAATPKPPPQNLDVAMALLKKAQELKKFLVMGALIVTMTGCAGFGLKVEGYRIDAIQNSQQTLNKPWKCLFVPCPQLEAQTAGEGN